MSRTRTFPDAAVLGAVPKLRELMAGGADIHEPDQKGRTALFRVCRVGQTEKALILLAAGADPNATDHQGEAPLQSAARYGHLDCVRALLQAGAHLDYCPSPTLTRYSESALCSAVRKCPDAALLLLEAGANVNTATAAKIYPLLAAVMKNDPSLVRLLLQRGASIEIGDSHGFGPLHWAAEVVSLAIMKLLLQAGANVNMRNDRGETPVHRAIGEDGKSLAVLKELVSAKPDLSIISTSDDETPLECAIRRMAKKAAKLLREAGSPPPRETAILDDGSITITVSLDDLEGAEGLVETEVGKPADTDWRFSMEPVNEEDILPTAQDTQWARQADRDVPSLRSVLGDRVSIPHWEFLKHADKPLPLTRMAYYARGWFNRRPGQELADGKRMLGETYESAAKRFVAGGFLRQVVGAEAICHAFTQSALSTMAKRNQIKVSGSKHELAQRLCSALGETAFAERVRAQGGYFELTPLGVEEIGNYQSARTDLELRQKQEVLAALTEQDFLRAAKSARILALLKNSRAWVKVKSNPENIAHARFIRSRQLPSSLSFSPGLETRYLAIASAHVLCDLAGDTWCMWDATIEPPKTNQGQPVKLTDVSNAMLG